jgi:hypothetical protein
MNSGKNPQGMPFTRGAQHNDALDMIGIGRSLNDLRDCRFSPPPDDEKLLAGGANDPL